MIYGYIYGMRCKVNGKWYIGLTTQDPLTYIKDSYKYHKGGKRTKFARALKKYGYENFDICLLGSSETKENLNLLEAAYILECNSVKNGYNLKEGGSHGKHSESTKKKISASNMGNKSRLGIPQTEETKMKIGNSNRGEKSAHYGKPGFFTGKKHTDESKKKMSLENQGRTHTVETKEKISKNSVNIWANISDEKRKEWSTNISESKKGSKNPMYGQGWRLKGKRLSPEAKEKLSKVCFKKGNVSWIKGKSHTKESLEKMRLAGKKRGDPLKKFSPEERQAIMIKIQQTKLRNKLEKEFHILRIAELFSILLNNKIS